MRGPSTIRGPPLIGPSPRRGGRGQIPRGYTIAWSRKRDKCTGSSTIFRYYGGPMTILIGGWRILGYGGTIGDDQSRPR